MSTRVGKNYKPVKGPDGKTRLVLDTKAQEAKLDLSTRMKKRNSKKQTWKPAK